MGRLGELDVGIFDDFEPVAPGIEKIEELTLDHPGAGRLRQLYDARTVVDDEADMAALDALMPVVGHPRDIDELVAQVDEGVALALAAQFEIEDSPVPFERLVDVADLDRDMVDADEPWFPAVGHSLPPVWRCLAGIWPHSGARRKPGKKGTLYCRGRGGYPNVSKAAGVAQSPSKNPQLDSHTVLIALPP